MKKQVYFTIIGIGAVLAIIGFIPGGMSGIWGVLIAGITGVLYYFNKRNETKVNERLEGEEKTFQRETTTGTADQVTSEEPEVSEEPESEGDTPPESPEE